MLKIYLDTNIFRDAFEGSNLAPALLAIFQKLRKKPKIAVTSEFTLAELLGKEIPGLGWMRQRSFYLDLIVSSGFVDLRPVTRPILIKTGEYRRSVSKIRKVKLPDAIHVVTAAEANCTYILTSDRGFVVSAPMKLIAPDSIGLGIMDQLLDA